MRKTVLFIQGGGTGGYEADIGLVESLTTSLGENYQVQYPRMPSDDSKADFGWVEEIAKEIESATPAIILVAHSLGASMLLKHLSEHSITKQIDGIFFLATPYWSGDEDWVKGLKLRDDFEQHLPENIPYLFYQCRDDEVVTFDQFLRYKQKLPRAVFVEISTGGHLFNNDLSDVASDIKTLLQ